MGWSIGVLVNTVKISKKCAKELFDAQGGENGEIWYSLDSVTYKKHLTFNYDHQEWMDYLHSGTYSDEIINILKKHKVKGQICFGSLEGDNAGSFWGYEFDGNGNCKDLEGEIIWK